MPEIKIDNTDEEITSTFALMHQLRTQLIESEYLGLVRKQQALGYLLASERDGPRVVAVAGFKLARSLAWGDYVYIDDLITDPKLRSAGHGARLMSWVAEYGRQRGCKEMHLDSGVQRFAAHRFYLRERMDITCHHFCVSLA